MEHVLADQAVGMPPHLKGQEGALKPVKRERLPTLRKRLTEACKDRYGVSSFAMVSDRAVVMHVATICHAPVKTASDITELYENISSQYRTLPEEHKQTYKAWVDYILNRSPWRNAFITKKWGVAIAHNVEMNCKMSREQIMSAITALRTGREFYKTVLSAFKTLSPLLGENVAWILSHFIQDGIFSTSASQHQAIHSGMHTESVIDFFKTPLKEISPTPISHSSRFCRGVWEVIALTGARGICSHLLYKGVLSERKGEWTIDYLVDMDKLIKEVKTWNI